MNYKNRITDRTTALLFYSTYMPNYQWTQYKTNQQSKIANVKKI